MDILYVDIVTISDVIGIYWVICEISPVHVETGITAQVDHGRTPVHVKFVLELR